MIDSIILLLGNLLVPYLIMSLFAILLVEFISQVFSLRAKTLRETVYDMLGVKLGRKFYEHPLIKSLSPGQRDPAYIPSKIFALALIDKVRREAGEQDFVKAMQKIAEDKPRIAIESLRQSHRTEVDFVQEWFLEAMDQASGLYRWRTLLILALVACALVLPLNFDAIQISNYVAERELNAKILETLITTSAKEGSQPASGSKDQPSTPAAGQQLGTYIDRYKSASLPIGWTSFSRNKAWIFTKVVGLLISILAIMLGAPFLFDVLNRFTIVRFTVKPYERFPAAAAEGED